MLPKGAVAAAFEMLSATVTVVDTLSTVNLIGTSSVPPGLTSAPGRDVAEKPGAWALTE